MRLRTPIKQDLIALLFVSINGIRFVSLFCFSQSGMNRLLSAFRCLVPPGVRAGFATSAPSAQVSSTATLRTAVSLVKPPNGESFFPSASFAHNASDVMRFVELRDADRLKALQPQQFVRPKPGDIVEVDFINLNLNNMNKTQKFKGICIEARKGLASSSFVLRCVVDEVGMQYR